MVKRAADFTNCGIMVTFYDLPRDNPEKAVRSLRRMIKQKKQKEENT